jgi:uncharacterized protein YgiM (DUF1202 family)
MSKTTFNSGDRVRVVTAYQTPFPDPLVIRAGESLTLGRRQSDWAGWVWCTGQTGHSGWVPEAYLDRQQGNLALANRDYDATELSAAVGETLTVHKAESGWVWCTDPHGRQGWIAAAYVARL